MKFTKSTLQKVENIFKELGYAVRYEKGNFQSGYCILDQKKVVVINKFFDTEGRINTLLDILSTLEIPEAQLSKETIKNIKKYLAFNIE
jgi:hypothetical protein